jgi:hypothetical protein
LSGLSEIARVLVRFDYVARVIVNTNHPIMRAAVKVRVADGVTDFQVPQPTERQRIGHEINPALVFPSVFVPMKSALHFWNHSMFC